MGFLSHRDHVIRQTTQVQQIAQSTTEKKGNKPALLNQSKVKRADTAYKVCI